MQIINSARRLVSWLIIPVAALATVFTVATPAQAADTIYSGHFTFDFTDHRLYFKVVRRVCDPGCPVTGTTVLSTSWASGSGDGTTNTCVRDQGRLPDGNYDVTAYRNWTGRDVGTDVFLLNDMPCSAFDYYACNRDIAVKHWTCATTRTELFIHTSQGVPNSLSSEGCIKLSSADLQDALEKFKQYHFSLGQKYPSMLTVRY